MCAVWNKVGGVFQNGFLAHVGNPHTAYFATAIANIPGGAWIVACVGTGQRGGLIAVRLAQANHAADHIRIYPRHVNAGFGIDKHGRFGEV